MKKLESRGSSTVKISTKTSGELIRNSRGHFFSVKFVKRTDGTIRYLTARSGVHSSPHVKLTGKGMSFSPSEKNLINVYVPAVKSYRNIPVENILELKTGGIQYQVED